ncbi:MAG: tetratricopeptide repeat protein [Pseudomonadota bacterium]
MANDQRGITLTGANTAQAAAFDAIIDDYMEYRLSTFPKLKELCAAAPDFAMANLFKAYLLQSMGSRDTLPAVLSLCDHWNNRRDELSPTEQLHLHALRAWAEGELLKACDYWDDILILQPTDLLALKLQHFNLFWLGRPQHMLDAVIRAKRGYDQTTPGYANLLGMQAFALEELNRYDEAEALGREAVERHGEDLWAVHAVAHVLEMQGRTHEGIDWLHGDYDQWDDRNPFRGHLWWHRAMFYYEAGEYEQALELFDHAVQPAESTFYLDIQNTVSLLARLEFAGVDVGERWNAACESAKGRIGDHAILFTEPHCAMAFAHSSDKSLLQQHRDSLHNFAKDANPHTRGLVECVVDPVCRAIADLHNGDAEHATDTLLQLRYSYQAMGASHAQRDVLALYLIEAATRADRLPLAHALLHERTQQNPNSFNAWSAFKCICEKMGDSSGASNSETQLKRIASKH